MTLLPIPNEAHEQEMAQAFLDRKLGDSEELTIPKVRELLVRYWHARNTLTALLKTWVDEDKGGERPDDIFRRAKEEFESEKCPACGEVKRKCKDFFCKKCFYTLPEIKRVSLLSGWSNGNNVSKYCEAREWLKGKLAKVGE